MPDETETEMTEYVFEIQELYQKYMMESLSNKQWN